MKLGVDTSFLVRATMAGCDGHAESYAFLHREFVSGHHQLAIATPVLAELIHMVTDSRRFSNPMTLPQAIAAAGYWWSAAETVRVYPSAAGSELFLDWMLRFKLGRKRLLDTQLAAIYVASDVHWIVTTDAEHFRIFPDFHPIIPGKGKPPS